MLAPPGCPEIITPISLAERNLFFFGPANSRSVSNKGHLQKRLQATTGEPLIRKLFEIFINTLNHLSKVKEAFLFPTRPFPPECCLLGANAQSAGQGTIPANRDGPPRHARSPRPNCPPVYATECRYSIRLASLSAADRLHSSK